MPTIWVTTPTATTLDLGFAINAMFDLDPGRSNLGWQSPKNKELAEKLGDQFGEVLCELFDKCQQEGWERFRADLKLQEQADRYEFWSSLWNLFTDGLSHLSEGHQHAIDLVRTILWDKKGVLVDAGTTIVVRFEHGIEQCLASELVGQSGPTQAVDAETWHSPLEVVTRVQAECIQSVNDTWGVFSLSRIALLPHQLWVCRKVLESWPTRWLVADDVGLGKTIEAGLILWPLLSRGTVKRLLVLCPASLVDQWQVRLRTMFDIRLAHYAPDADRPQAEFWDMHTQVVASLQTLRADHRGRHQRMLDAPAWDLLIVDEAHHLNSDEQTGATLGYQLVEKLVKHRKIMSAVFFTGTPHRGKNYGFLNLLKLLKPDVFDPKKPLQDQLARLREVMIRNNKQCVTDLRGRPLFQAPRVTAETYRFCEQEEAFYDLLTMFAARFSTLPPSDGRSWPTSIYPMSSGWKPSDIVGRVRSALTRSPGPKVGLPLSSCGDAVFSPGKSWRPDFTTPI